MEDILKLSLTDLAEEIKSRRLSPVELVKAVISRVEETHAALNAVIAVRDPHELLADAERAEKRVMGGEVRPLEGIPFGVKDLEDAEGLVTSMGSVPFRDNMAETDSTQVSRLKQAGGIVFGKTNTPEFGFNAISTNFVHGTTRNPWNLEHTPGGSSGGSAAAISGCVLPMATASDGGGSIRIPSSFCGTFGLKPTFGRIPKGPFKQWPYSDTSVFGPITKTVADAALLMDQVVGPDPYDPTSLPHPGLSYQDVAATPLSGSLDIAFSLDLVHGVVQSDVAGAVEEGVKVFEDLGHRVHLIDSSPPLVDTDWGLLTNFDNAASLLPHLPDREGDFRRAYLAGVRNSWRMTPERWAEAAIRRSEVNNWCAETFNSYHLLVTPTVPYDPPPPEGPFPSETEGQEHKARFSVAVFTIPFNQSGHPAATVRVGLSKAGLPMGMQIVGPRYGEDLVLQASRAFEKERPWHPDWPTGF